MNFIGRYYHALEQKGRIAVPASFRRQLGEQGILTRGLEGCLFLFPTSSWEKTTQGIANNPFTSKDVREWTRLLVHHANISEFDSQGRILIPEHLRAYALLESECVIAGSLEYIEIWDRQKYHSYMDTLENRAEEIAEKMSQKGNV